MKTTIELNEEDIAVIIASVFECEPIDVSIFTTTKQKGYGLNETEVQVCAATVELDSERMKKKWLTK